MPTSNGFVSKCLQDRSAPVPHPCRARAAPVPNPFPSVSETGVATKVVCTLVESMISEGQTSLHLAIPIYSPVISQSLLALLISTGRSQDRLTHVSIVFLEVQGLYTAGEATRGASRLWKGWLRKASRQDCGFADWLRRASRMFVPQTSLTFAPHVVESS